MFTHRYNHIILADFLISLAFALILGPSPVKAQDGVAHAVLFYSPSCPHCQKVINQDLPPLQQKYGDQLNIFSINVGNVEGQALYRAAVERYNIPEERRGVPCLIVGDTVLVGSLEIPDQLPGIIEEGLKAGGISWPDIPGLNDMLPTQAEVKSKAEPAPAEAGFLTKFARDLLGNSLALVVLIGLVASAAISITQVIRLPEQQQRIWPEWMPFTLVTIGSGIALYLSYVELTHTQAVCGPVGDCNTVQQSPYATLFGMIPVGIFGIAGYVLIALAWLAQKFGTGRWNYFCALQPDVCFIWRLVLSISPSWSRSSSELLCAWCLASAIDDPVIMGFHRPSD
jgi:uncharacterized membrane protein